LRTRTRTRTRTRSSTRTRPRSTRVLTAIGLLATAAVVGLSGCAASSSATEPTTSPNGAAHFPVTIENCGTPVTITAAPRRIVLVNNDELPNLEALHAVDRIVGITAPLAPDLYAKQTYRDLARLHVLSTKQTSTGGSVVSQESLLGAKPDLVIAPANAVDRDALQAAGIPLYTPSAYCTDPGPELSSTATFGRVWSELRTLGTVLGEQALAEDAVQAGRATLAKQSASTDRGTAAALYVSSGGGVLSPYGGPSMVTPVFHAVGLHNVYADAKQRVFDANVEDIISRDPSTIVLLYSSGTAQDTIDSFRTAPGVSGLSAVRHHRVVALRFPFTDPPSTLSVAGPAELARQLDALG